MSKNTKQKTNQKKTRGTATRRGVVILAVLVAVLAIGGATISFRMTGSPTNPDTDVETTPDSSSSLADSGETIAPVTEETTAPESTSSGAQTSERTTTTAESIPVVITPEPIPDTTTEQVTIPPIQDDDPARVTYHPITDPVETEPLERVIRVPESDAVEDSYFSDAVFIGDSRTVGLSLYSGLKSNYYSQQGLNVSSVQKTAYVPSADGETKLTLAEALEANSTLTKVYLSFGINEIGWPSTDSFINTYAALVDLVREKLPDACIYVQEILPMYKATAENERYSAMGGNGKVAEYNQRLYQLCEEKGAYYIALTEIFADENGDLNVADSGDGIHLGVASSKNWVSYLKTHTVS